MSITPILPEDIETFTLETSPTWTFASSSTGITGSAYVFQRRSLREKEIYPLSMYSASLFEDQNITTYLKLAKNSALSASSNFSQIQSYLAALDTQQPSVRKQQTVEIIRFTPGFGLSQNIYRKGTVLNSYFPYYRHIYPSLQYAFNNYNCFNFISSSAFPSDSVLLYPQLVSSSGTTIVSASYAVSASFSFDFWIKPKNTTDNDTAPYKPGTIMALSGCYAISLLSGSSKDADGRPNKFRLLFQLSGAANIPPSNINVSNLPSMAFVSDDNSLLKDTWHHVTIRWGTSQYNLGSGSILIDEVSRGNFTITQSALSYKTTGGSDGPVALCVGNFYEGTNSGVNAMSRFFTTAISTREGLMELYPDTSIRYPTTYSFTHPLNAELSELKIYNKYLIDSEVSALRTNGPQSFENLVFYVPPFFTQESPTRQLVGNDGGIFVTPFQTRTGTTETPFSAELAFEVGGHYINLENFTREMVGGTYPRLLGLSGSIVTAPGSFPETANAILYSTASIRRRNLTILPCDNANFFPSYKLLIGLSSSYFHNDLYNEDLSLVSLRDIYPTSSLLKGLQIKDVTTDRSNNSLINDLMGPDPSDNSTFGKVSGYVPTILQRTKDNTSNQVVFFDVSTLFYDQNIEPGSLIMVDSAVSSSDKLSITLKDDGYGNLYRADTAGEAATWNSVGNVLYNEGIILIKHPSLFMFGESQFSISFKGRHDIHILTIDCLARTGMVTSSSNPSYIEGNSTSNVNEADQKYVWISDVLIHDENLNVITKTKLAQHFQKKTGDKALFKIKMDF